MVLCPPYCKDRQVGGLQAEAGQIDVDMPESPRIAVATEPYPNRLTHHVLAVSPEDIDGELMAWIEESHQFSLTKRRGKRA